MFSFDISDTLAKKLDVLSKKDRILCIIFRKKLREIIGNDLTTIDRYKNLRAPLDDCKRVHLTDAKILIFKVYKSQGKVLFVDIVHWDKAY